MPKQTRFKTKYPGVYFIAGTGAGGKPERIYYIMFRRNGRLIEEKAGRQFQDDMTPARAAGLRARRMEGDPTNEERREAERVVQDRWTITRLWEEYKAQNPQVKAIAKDEDRFDCYLKGAVGEKEPRELVPLDVDRLRVKLSKRLQPATVRNVLELLRRVVNFGVKKQLCEGCSFHIQMPKVDNQRTEDLSPDELNRLIKAIDADDNLQVANIMRIALFTGMRKSEIFKLKWTDIDLEKNFIHIENPKGGRDVKIPLNNDARSIFLSHPRTPGSEFVFPGQDGGSRRNVHRAVTRIKERAKLPKDFRPLHGLRHVYASMLASSGMVDLFTLQRLLTHRSPMMTQRYAHLRDEALRRASNLAGTIITGIRNGKEEESEVG